MRSIGLGGLPWAEIVAAEMTLFSQGKPADMSYFEDMVRDKLLETYVVDVDDETSAFDLITSGSKFQKDSTPKEQGTLEQALEAIDKSYESSDVDYGDSIEINEDGEQVEKL